MEGINKEVYVFLWFALSGGICGIIFDLFRAIRKTTNPPDWIVYMEDVLYWLIVAVIMMFTAYLRDSGIIRVYMFLGMLLGGIIYFFIFSKFCYKVFLNFCRIISKVIGYIYLPFKKLIKFTYNKIRQLGKVFSQKKSNSGGIIDESKQEESLT